jgi:hypothetical protein
MELSSILNNGLKLKQIVKFFTRKKEILDVLMTNVFQFYNSPVIIPPVQPDIPGQGVPSDHSVPMCVPHTDPHNPPAREYKTVVSRPLPDSKIREFGQWITIEQWEEIIGESDPTQQVRIFETFIEQKLDQYFPHKITKLGIGDKVFMTAELKTLKRKRMREYRKNGKSDRNTRLLKEFEVKFKKTAGDFMRKNIDSLKNTNPGRAYSILKKMGAKPGDCE